MHPYLSQLLADARLRDVRATPAPPEPGGSTSGPAVLIRSEGRLLVAEIEGRVAAALPLDGTAPEGDPELLSLLELRAAQLAA